jgi:hypothetical protein
MNFWTTVAAVLVALLLWEIVGIAVGAVVEWWTDL